MDVNTYMAMINKPQDLSDAVDSLNYTQRIELRTQLEKNGCRQLIRNLYYDYERQRWIQPEVSYD